MSFFHTERQIRERTKTVTRRRGQSWAKLKPGERFWAIRKGQGLKKGERVERICLLECVSNGPTVLMRITKADVRREGFPELSQREFVAMFRLAMGGAADQTLHRIEFKYV